MGADVLEQSISFVNFQSPSQTLKELAVLKFAQHKFKMHTRKWGSATRRGCKQKRRRGGRVGEQNQGNNFYCTERKMQARMLAPTQDGTQKCFRNNKQLCCSPNEMLEMVPLKISCRTEDCSYKNSLLTFYSSANWKEAIEHQGLNNDL